MHRIHALHGRAPLPYPPAAVLWPLPLWAGFFAYTVHVWRETAARALGAPLALMALTPPALLALGLTWAWLAVAAPAPGRPRVELWIALAALAAPWLLRAPEVAGAALLGAAAAVAAAIAAASFHALRARRSAAAANAPAPEA